MFGTNLRLSALFRKFHFIAIIAIILIFIIIEVLFLYRFFYVPLTETKIIGALREQTALQPIRIDIFENLKLVKEKKQQLRAIDWSVIRDPFKKQAQEKSNR